MANHRIRRRISRQPSLATGALVPRHNHVVFVGIRSPRKPWRGSGDSTTFTTHGVILILGWGCGLRFPGVERVEGKPEGLVRPRLYANAIRYLSCTSGEQAIANPEIMGMISPFLFASSRSRPCARFLVHRLRIHDDPSLLGLLPGIISWDQLLHVPFPVLNQERICNTSTGLSLGVCF